MSTVVHLQTAVLPGGHGSAIFSVRSNLSCRVGLLFVNSFVLVVGLPARLVSLYLHASVIRIQRTLILALTQTLNPNPNSNPNPNPNQP